VTDGTIEHTAHIGRRFVDVSPLPTFAFGHRDPIWWGIWMLIAIEGTMFALLASSYFYLRGNFSQWPPPGAEDPPSWIMASTVIVLLLSAVPAYWAYRAALFGKLRTIQIGMLLCTLLNLAAIGTRAGELLTIGYNWNSHAYGSVVWAIYFMHTLHLVAGAGENIVLTSLLFVGPVEKKLMPDVRASAIYWWFVVFGWIPLWAMLELV
jgi:heme/copper-type cytochrome/quinol oxidase subunit 3